MNSLLFLLKLMFSDGIGGRLKALALTKLNVETANRQSSNRVRAYRTHALDGLVVQAVFLRQYPHQMFA